MTKNEAKRYVRDHDDYDHDDDEIDEVFAALYGREPDERDREDGVWSLCCAAVSLSSAASALGRKGRSVNSPAQQQAARDNGKKGGRPAGDTTLTTLQQQILALRQSGLKIKEIADRLGRNPENIRQTLARAMRKSGMTGGWTETARKG